MEGRITVPLYYTHTREEEHSQLAIHKGAEGKRCNKLLAISSALNVNQYTYLEDSEPNSIFNFINQKVGNTAFDFNFIRVIIQRTMTRLGEASTFHGFPKF